MSQYLRELEKDRNLYKDKSYLYLYFWFLSTNEIVDITAFKKNNQFRATVLKTSYFFTLQYLKVITKKIMLVSNVQQDMQSLE